MANGGGGCNSYQNSNNGEISIQHTTGAIEKEEPRCKKGVRSLPAGKRELHCRKASAVAGGPHQRCLFVPSTPNNRISISFCFPALLLFAQLENSKQKSEREETYVESVEMVVAEKPLRCCLRSARAHTRTQSRTSSLSLPLRCSLSLVLNVDRTTEDEHESRFIVGSLSLSVLLVCGCGASVFRQGGWRR